MKIKNWTIISEPFYKGKVKYIKVKCSCGIEKEMIHNRVFHKTLFNKCKSCATKENNSKKINQGYKSIGNLGGTYYNYLKKKAKQRNLEFDISKEFLWNLFIKQNSKCALSNLNITLSRNLTGKNINFNLISASLDRIDSNYGYTEKNVQWVHKWINTMKNTLSNSDFIYICKSVANNHDNFEPNLEERELNFSRKVQRLTDEDTRSNNSDKSTELPLMRKEDDIV